MSVLSDRIIIDGDRFDIPVKEFARTYNYDYKYDEVVEDGTRIRELRDIYGTYTITFGRTNDTDEYEALVEKLLEPVNYHVLVIPGHTGDDSNMFYVDSVADTLKNQYKGNNYFGDLSISVTARNPE
jgi:hypothetical protein